ncbi:MAG TPA: exosortase/archaeosortase family protein [Terriglobales bacterium]|nr:exosortase/archaeosortase family protein [Terriglobales bacterium]
MVWKPATISTTDITGATEIPKTTEAHIPKWPLSTRVTHWCAAASWVVSLVLFRDALNSLAGLSLHDDRASHILLIPVISGFLLYLERKRIFGTPRVRRQIGLALILLALVLWFTLKTRNSSVFAALIVLVWIATFIFWYGTDAFKAATFPLLFLGLMIPLPAVIAEHIVSVLQKGSAEVCYALFRFTGVPVVRQGLVFSLPGIDIEVAKQCSGIHSALSLFIAGLLAEHVFLQGIGKKLAFTLLIVPIAIFKNAVRIVVISWLGIYVDPGFFHGALHRQGGLPFSLLAIGMMGLLLWLLRNPTLVSRFKIFFRGLPAEAKP